MRRTTIWCDQCGAETGAVFSSGRVEGEFCGPDCIRAAETPSETEECPHDDNASDEVPGRATARLVCKACGYDREVEVA